MSLRRLLKWHYFTVMSNEHAQIDDSGGIDRKLGYVVKNLNLQGNLQATLVSSSKGRNDIVTKYNLAEFETYYTIYHKYSPENLDYNFTPGNRVIINKNPRKQITENMINAEGSSSLRMFQVIGCREPVALRVRFEFYEMYLVEIHRFTF
jgi:hypothetical protein